MGDVRALNVWLSLSRCGDEAPGMDIVPRRLDHIVPTGTEGAVFDWSVSPQVAEEAAGETRDRAADLRARGRAALRRPLPALDGRRAVDAEESLAIESWFFGASASPAQYAPLARLSRAAEPARFFFVHMQKTGGISLYVRMKRHFGRRGVYPDPSDGESDGRWPRSSSCRCCSSAGRSAPGPDPRGDGHFPLCTIELLDADFTTLTVLRDPVERTLSYLRHHRETTPGDASCRSRRSTRTRARFRHFIENHMVKMLSLRAEEMTNGMMTWSISTGAGFDEPSGRCARWTSSASRRISRDFAQRLERRFGWRARPAGARAT